MLIFFFDIHMILIHKLFIFLYKLIINSKIIYYLSGLGQSFNQF